MANRAVELPAPYHLDRVIDIDTWLLSVLAPNAHPLTQVIRPADQDHTVLEYHAKSLHLDERDVFLESGTGRKAVLPDTIEEAWSVRGIKMVRRELLRCDIELLILHDG
jgi:hypothetical protein